MGFWPVFKKLPVLWRRRRKATTGSRQTHTEREKSDDDVAQILLQWSSSIHFRQSWSPHWNRKFLCLNSNFLLILKIITVLHFYRTLNVDVDSVLMQSSLYFSQFNMSFYMTYLARWPDYFHVAEAPGSRIMGYSEYRYLFVSFSTSYCVDWFLC